MTQATVSMAEWIEAQREIEELKKDLAKARNHLAGAYNMLTGMRVTGSAAKDLADFQTFLYAYLVEHGIFSK